MQKTTSHSNNSEPNSRRRCITAAELERRAKISAVKRQCVSFGISITAAMRACGITNTNAVSGMYNQPRAACRKKFEKFVNMINTRLGAFGSPLRLAITDFYPIITPTDDNEGNNNEAR